MKRIYVLLFALLYIGIAPAKAQYDTLLNFIGPNGQAPNSDLIISGKVLYGTSGQGGLHGFGTIFSVDTDGNRYKDLLDFDSANGKFPIGPLVISGNKLFGMTSEGGTHDRGCLFSIDTDGNAYKILLNFDSANGTGPGGSLTLSNNTLYGTTGWGGAHNFGTIFSIDTNGSRYKDLWDFEGYPADGEVPGGSLILSGKVLFGLTSAGGANSDGIIFSIDTNGNGYKKLYDFGIAPSGSLALLGNTLFGATDLGGMGYGFVFSIDTNGSRYKDILDFDYTNGGFPDASFIILNNTLYGMTQIGGTGFYGVIFSLDTNGSGYNDLYNFSKDPFGGIPYGYLTFSGETLYGMTTDGGTINEGVIFRFTDKSLGINQTASAPGAFNVYPNPSGGAFTIEAKSEELISNSMVEIYNVLGEKVYSEALPQSESTNTIKLTGQPDGIYLYRVLSETGSLLGEGKLVIQK